MSEDTMEDRRLHDRTHSDIRELILQTDTPKDKAMLLILLKISESLESNTALTQEVATKLDSHIKKYEIHETEDKVRVGSIRTGWKVLSVVLIFLQGLTAMAIKSYGEDYRSLVQSVSSLRQETSQSFSTIRRDVDALQERRRIEDEFNRRKEPS